jgi:hypothetical protein
MEYNEIAAKRRADDTDNDRLVRDHFQSVKSVKSVKSAVHFLCLRLCRAAFFVVASVLVAALP